MKRVIKRVHSKHVTTLCCPIFNYSNIKSPIRMNLQSVPVRTNLYISEDLSVECVSNIRIFKKRASIKNVHILLLSRFAVYFLVRWNSRIKDEHILLLSRLNNLLELFHFIDMRPFILCLLIFQL